MPILQGFDIDPGRRPARAIDADAVFRYHAFQASITALGQQPLSVLERQGYT
jgi:hypothetical protein